jgi:hypothetical protein
MERENASCRGERFPMTNGRSRVLFESSSKKVQTLKLESSRGLLTLSKEVHSQIKQEDEDSAFSNGNLPLCTTPKRFKSSIPPHEGGVLHDKHLQTLSKIKHEPIGGPNSARMGPIEILQHKRKSPMQPFADLPQRTKGRGRTSLDVKRKQLKWKSVHE